MTTATRTNPLTYLTDQLNDLKQRGTYFKLRVLEDEQAPVCTFDGKRVINLASNNYLGLTTHPKLREAALEATKKFGVGSGAGRTIAGTMSLPLELGGKSRRFKNIQAVAGEDQGLSPQGHGPRGRAAERDQERAGQEATDHRRRVFDGWRHRAAARPVRAGGEVRRHHD